MALYKRAAHRVVLAESGDIIVRPSRLERTVHEGFGSSMNQHFMTAYGRRRGTCGRAAVLVGGRARGAGEGSPRRRPALAQPTPAHRPALLAGHCSLQTPAASLRSCATSLSRKRSKTAGGASAGPSSAARERGAALPDTALACMAAAARRRWRRPLNRARRPCSHCSCTCRLLQRVLRVTAGVRQETMVRLGRTSLAHPSPAPPAVGPTAEEQLAAAERLLRHATGSRLGSLPHFRRGGRAPPDQHLALGRRLEQAAALLAGRRSASSGLAGVLAQRSVDTLSQMASAPLPGLSFARRSPPRASRLGRQPAAARSADASEAV